MNASSSSASAGSAGSSGLERSGAHVGARNALGEAWLLGAREVGRNLRSVKGIALLVLSLAGGALASLVLLKLQGLQSAAMHDAPPEAYRAFRTQLLAKAYGDDAIGAYLAGAPEVLFVVFQLTVWLSPLLVTLLGFDAVAGDLQHRTVRFWTMRVRRESYVVGKALGLFGTVAAVVGMMHVFVWVVAIARGEPASDVLVWGLRFLGAALPVALAWCGLGLLVSSLLRTPALSLLVTCVTFFVVWLVHVAGSVHLAPSAGPAGEGGASASIGVGADPGSRGLLSILGDWVYPSAFDGRLLSPEMATLGVGLLVAIGYAVVTTGAAALLFAKRDV